jgi:hypothetical protein
MSSLIQSGNSAHDQNCLTSLGKLQAAVVPGVSQATVNTATILHLRTCIASAIANKCGTDPFVAALKGTFGLNV